MTNLSNRFRTLSKNLIDKYGANVSIIRDSLGSFDPATQTTSPNTVLSDNVKAVITEFKSHEIDGDNVRYGDKKVLIPILGLNNLSEIVPSDIIELNSKRYSVLKAEAIMGGDSIVSYDVHIRS